MKEKLPFIGQFGKWVGNAEDGVPYSAIQENDKLKIAQKKTKSAEGSLRILPLRKEVKKDEQEYLTS